MTNIIIVAQVIGFFAMLCEIQQFQIKQSKNILAMDILVGALWGVQFALLGLWPAVVCCSFKMIRGGLSRYLNQNHLHYGLIALVTLLIASGFYWCLTLTDWFPFIATSLASVALLYRENRYIVARIFLIGAVLWLCFNFYNHAYMAALSCALILGSNLIGIYRHEFLIKRTQLSPVKAG